MPHLYIFFIKLYALLVRLASVWNPKAAEWINGRKDVFERLQSLLSAGDRVIWMHCSSAGEFEQGKPVIEALKQIYPAKKIVVTFFSPSGYRVAKNYPFADIISYLPVDSRENAKRFYQLVQPELALFVKYEFWYNFLSVAAFYHTPILLISATFRKNQVFFRRYGGFFRQMLHLFRHIFVQDPSSLQLLTAAGIHHCSIGGDTRFDRVVSIIESADVMPLFEEFSGGRKVIVAGSTWPGDEAVLAQYLNENPEVYLILAPHEINAAHTATLQKLFPDALFYSTARANACLNRHLPDNRRVLIVDAVGLLSRLYQYATIAYVGGGFTSDGIHNILEAAVWEKPVVFGPRYSKYREAEELIACGGAASFSTPAGLKKIADELLANEHHLQSMRRKAKAYIDDNTGATGNVVRLIQEKRLLTN